MESNFPQTLKSNWIEMLLFGLFGCHLKRYVEVYCHVEVPKCLCVWSHEAIEVLALLPSADTRVARKPKTPQGSPALRSCCAIVIQPWVHGTCFRHPLVWKEEWLWRDFVHQNWNVLTPKHVKRMLSVARPQVDSLWSAMSLAMQQEPIHWR